MKLKTIPTRILKAFLNLIYPPSCLHCKGELFNPDYLLCQDCLIQLEIIDPLERCLFCFTSECDLRTRICSDCYGRLSFLDGICSAFDFEGPAASLVKKMKYNNMPYLNKGIAAYMGAQFCRMNWPMPDLIVPVPISIPHLFLRGYNQSALLAETLSSLLNRPTCDILKRKSLDYSQAGLNREQRKALGKESFLCKKGSILEDKILLLIDDVMTTGSTLRCCAEALQAFYPKNIYALTFCRAL